MPVTFYLNGETEICEASNDQETLLEYLRQTGKNDTKKMCQEGGCGVCTVVEIFDANGQEVKFLTEIL